MADAKRFLITTRTSEIFIVRPVRTGKGMYCPVCKESRGVLTLDEAVSLTLTGTRDLIAHTETGELHAIESAAGHLLLCGESLRIFFEVRL